MGGSILSKEKQPKVFKMQTFDDLQAKNINKAYAYAKLALKQPNLTSREKIMWTINCAQVKLQLSFLNEA